MHNVAHPQHYVISLYNIICHKSELEFKNINKNIIILYKYKFVKKILQFDGRKNMCCV